MDFRIAVPRHILKTPDGVRLNEIKDRRVHAAPALTFHTKDVLKDGDLWLSLLNEADAREERVHILVLALWLDGIFLKTLGILYATTFAHKPCNETIRPLRRQRAELAIVLEASAATDVSSDRPHVREDVRRAFALRVLQQEVHL